MIETPTLYIPTCDDNSFVLKYFQYFFNKYWGKHIKVKILGFNKPNIDFDENIEFISLGTEQIGGAKGWSNYLIDYFSSIDDEYFMFGLDDFMIVRPVDEEVFKEALNIMNKKIGRIDLQPLEFARNRSVFSDYIESNGIKFLKMSQSGSGLYRNAAAFSIWNKEWFLKNIRRDWTPWDWELIGTNLSLNDGYEVIGSSGRYTIKKSELLSKQWSEIINVLSIREEDIEHMKTLQQPEDRIKKFEVFGYDTYGYQDFAGKDWLNKIYGK